MSVAGSDIPLVQDEHGRPTVLPDDPIVLRRIVEELLKRLSVAQVRTQELEHQLQMLRRGLFGRKSEKLDPKQLQIFASVLGQAVGGGSAAIAPETEDAVSVTPKSARSRKKSGGRTLIPDHLPRQTIRHELNAQERACPKCGAERRELGVETSEELEIVPARLIVRKHERVKYMCTACGGEFATAAKPPAPLEKCAAGPGLLAHIVVSKVDDHLPAYRQSEILRRNGVDIPRATIGRWLIMTAFALRALYGLMTRRVRRSRVIHTDETGMPVLEPGRGQVHRGRMWTLLGDSSHPYIVFAYTRTKESKGIRDWLGDFRGFLQADAYGGFDQLYAKTSGEEESRPRILEVACWAHARRKFEQIRMNFPAQALTAIDFIRKLYAIEERARRMSPHRRRKLRRREAKPILARMRTWLDESALRELPNSELGKAIRYVLSNWTALTRYVDVGRLAIDNNAAERALRVVAVGRKNWTFAGHDEGAEALAILYTMIESAKRAGVNPEAWLRDVLAQIGDFPANRLDDLLPDRWKQRQTPSARHAQDTARARAASATRR